MTTTFPIDQNTGKAFARVLLSSSKASTFHYDHITLDISATVAEADAVVQRDALAELEWHTIISKPHVQNALRRLADEARRQIAAGEVEEGGFAIE